MPRVLVQALGLPEVPATEVGLRGRRHGWEEDRLKVLIAHVEFEMPVQKAAVDKSWS